MTIKEKYKFRFDTIDTGSRLRFDCRGNNPPTKNNTLSGFVSCLQSYDIVDFILENVDGAINGTYFDNEPMSDHWPDSDEIKISKSFFKINEDEFPIEDVKKLLLEWREFINFNKPKPNNKKIKKVGFWKNLYNMINGIS